MHKLVLYCYNVVILCAWLILQIRASDVDIMAKTTISTLDANAYPPRVKITVHMKDHVDMVRVRIKVKGSTNDEQFHTDLSFPFKGMFHRPGIFY